MKIAKIELSKAATWNANLYNGKGGYDYSQKRLEYNITGLVYKPKADDKIFTLSGKEIKPLHCHVSKKISSFSTGVNRQTGEPTLLRSFLAFALGKNPAIEAADTVVAPGILVFNKNQEPATPEETKKYLQEFLSFRKGQINISDFTMRNAGFFEVPDVRSLEGRYIGISVGAGSKITKFSKLPSSFTPPDSSIENEAMEKFRQAYIKLQQGRKEHEDNFWKVQKGQPAQQTNDLDSLIIDEPTF